MQGKQIIGAILAAALTPSFAVAGEPIKRPVCSKSEQQQSQQRQQVQQQRVKPPECRTTRAIPPVVDPTPWFLL